MGDCDYVMYDTRDSFTAVLSVDFVYYVYGLVGYTGCMYGHTYNVIINNNIIVHVHIKCVR